MSVQVGEAIRKRIEWIDALKGFAIIWLIVYHFHVWEWLKSPVGVFFFLSGLFFSTGNSFGSFIKKKAKALLVPFCFFFILGIVTLFAGSIIMREDYSFPPIWKLFTLLPITSELSNPIGVGAIWFLLALFDIYVIYYAIVRISKNKWWVIGVSCLFLILSAVLLQKYQAGSLFFLFNAMFFLPYFSVANLLKDFVLEGKFSWPFLLVLIIGYATSFIDLTTFSNSMGGGILLKVRDIISGLCLVLLLVYAFRSLSKFFSRQKAICHRFFLYEGKNSLTILGIHMLFQIVLGLALKMVLPVGTYYYLLLFVLELIGCNIGVWIFNRYVPFLVNH